MNNVSLIINTVTKNKDLWPMFFGQIEKHIPQNFFHEKHIFVNDCNEAFPDDYKISYFESDAVYQEQFTSCIQNVADEYCIYISEDYILYNDMRCDLVEKYVDILNKNKDLKEWLNRTTKGNKVEFNPRVNGKEFDVEFGNFIKHISIKQA